jgi:CubicO group peptidase (beta-lactamase class C family)
MILAARIGFCASPALDPALAARVDRIAAMPAARGRVMGLIVGVRVGAREQIFSYGAVVRGGGRPTSATIFEIGSVTKTFTATLLALFAYRGLVNLDDQLQTYVPGWVVVPKYDGQAITLLDLATHTAGLPEDPPMKDVRHLSTDGMYRYLASLELGRPPGRRYSYSNLGFALLAHALMAAVGSRYEPMVESYICAPLGMTDTRINLTARDIVRRAEGYGLDGQPARFDLRTWPAFNGAGALNSTMADMMKFLAFNMGAVRSPLDVILPIVQKPRHAAGAPGREVALAWEMRPLGPADSRMIIEKNGMTAGFAAYVGFVRESSTGIVILANQRFPVERLGVRLLRALNARADALGSAPLN